MMFYFFSSIYIVQLYILHIKYIVHLYKMSIDKCIVQLYNVINKLRNTGITNLLLIYLGLSNPNSFSVCYMSSSTLTIWFPNCIYPIGRENAENVWIIWRFGINKKYYERLYFINIGCHNIFYVNNR